MKIKLFVMDVDGTLTDGKIYMGENGEVMKAFNVKDGYAIAHMLPEMGIIPVIITGRKSKIVENRAKELELKIVAEKYKAAPEEIAYIGDDLNDLECIEYCGVTACPVDAVEEVKRKVTYVCKNNSGEGSVREFIENFK